MTDYNITLYLAGGATANLKQAASTDGAALAALEKALEDPICVLTDKADRMVLKVKNPDTTVIAYSVDRVEG